MADKNFGKQQNQQQDNQMDADRNDKDSAQPVQLDADQSTQDNAPKQGGQGQQGSDQGGRRSR